jgi:ComB9 competence protein
MPGFLRVTWRPDTVTTINIREGMLTVIRWPISETILSRELSDSKTFESRIGPDQRSIIVRSVFSGVDGNMVVYGQSGNVYNIYLRSAAFNSEKLPDTTVEMIVDGLGTNYGGTLHSTAPASAPYDDYRDLYKPSVTSRVEEFKAGSREWASSSPVSGKDMDTNIDILVPDRADQAIAPIRAWHDKNFTYLDFGSNASSMNQWPVASVLIDGSESPVGSRTTGPNGSIMIIEAIGDIVLRNGRHLVCLKLRNQPDNRVSPTTNVARNDGATATASTTEKPPMTPRPTAKPTRPVIRKGEAAKPVSKVATNKSADKAAPVVKPIPVAKEAPRTFQFDASGLTGKIH